MADAFPTVIGAAAGLLSGTLTAVVAHVLGRKATRQKLEESAEQLKILKEESVATIDKTKAETEKLRVEAGLLRERVANLGDAVSYRTADAKSSTIYDSRNGFDRFDFDLQSSDGAKAELSVEDGQVKDGVLNLLRTNTEGRMTIWVKRYVVDGNSVDVIPRRSSIPGTRKVRVECEARTMGGPQTLLLIIKGMGAPAGEYLGQQRQRLTSQGWVPIDAYFQFPVTQDCRLRFDDRSVDKAQSALQIRNLVVTERT
jgi:hypothetical protein